MIAITIAALVGGRGFVSCSLSLTGSLYKQLKEMRRRVESMGERAPSASDEARAIDESLTKLGFPKPNPMLAE